MFSRDRNRRQAKAGKNQKAASVPKVKGFRCCDYMCSKCHKRLKMAVYSKTQRIEMSYKLNPQTAKLEAHFEVIAINESIAITPLDHWCFRCWVDSSLLEKTPKFSKGRKKKLLEKIESDRQARLAEINRQIEERQKRTEAAAKNRPATVRKKAKPEDAPTLNFVYESAPAAQTVEIDEAIDYEVLASRIASISDPSLFDYVETDSDGTMDW